jgi:hypothetical protein
MKAFKPGRACRLVCLLIFALGVVQAHSMLSPPQAQAGIIPSIPSPCDLIPDGTAVRICKIVTPQPGSPIGIPSIPGLGQAGIPGFGNIPGLPTPSGILGSVTQDAAGAFFKEVIHYATPAIQQGLKKEWDFTSSSTTPHFTAAWILKDLAIVFGLSAIIAFAAFYFRIGMAVEEEDPVEGFNAFRAILIFFIVSSFIPLIMAGLVEIFDGVLGPLWIHIAGHEALHTLNHINKQLSDPSNNDSGLSLFLEFIFSILGAIGGGFVFLMFAYRLFILYFASAMEIVALGMWVSGRWGYMRLQQNTVLVLTAAALKPIVGFLLVIGLMMSVQSGIPPIMMGISVVVLTPYIAWEWYKRNSNDNPGAQYRWYQLQGYANRLRAMAQSPTP